MIISADGEFYFVTLTHHTLDRWDRYTHTHTTVFSSQPFRRVQREDYFGQKQREECEVTLEEHKRGAPPKHRAEDGGNEERQSECFALKAREEMSFWKVG